MHFQLSVTCSSAVALGGPARGLPWSSAGRLLRCLLWRFSRYGWRASTMTFARLDQEIVYAAASDSSDEELLARAREAAPEERAVVLEELFGRYIEQTVRWGLRLTHDEQEARDLAQDALLRAHRGLEGFRAESKFSTWLYTIVRRTAINRGQARRRRPTSSLEELQGDEGNPAWEPVQSESVVEQMHQRNRYRQLRTMMKEELDDEEMRVMALHYGEDLPLVAITDLLDLDNRSGAKATLVRAQRKLRRALASQEPPKEDIE